MRNTWAGDSCQPLILSQCPAQRAVMVVGAEGHVFSEPIPFSLAAYEMHHLEQGYLSTAPVVRIRKDDDNYILTRQFICNLSKALLECK